LQFRRRTFLLTHPIYSMARTRMLV